MKTRVKIIEKANGQIVYVPQKFDSYTIWFYIVSVPLFFVVFVMFIDCLKNRDFSIFSYLFSFWDSYLTCNTLQEARGKLERIHKEHYKKRLTTYTKNIRLAEEKKRNKVKAKAYLKYP